MMTHTPQELNHITRQNYTLLGEIISWNLQENTRVPYPDVVRALQAAGLDEKIAREMRPRHAFARAAKQLAEERIIRCIEDKPHMMRFQFTREQREQDEFAYRKETILQLDKDTGHIVSEDGNSTALVSEAQRLLEKAKNERTTADISRYIMTLFEKQADLFPVRAAGGVYFVPERHVGFVAQIDHFVNAVGGTVTRFPVPAGTKQGDKSVKEAVQAGLQNLIDEHLAAITEFGVDTRESTMTKAAQKVEQTRFKLEAYAEYLDDQKDRLLANVATLRLTLQQKVEQVLAAKKEAKRD